jgi:hypothetical protein
MEIFLQIEKIEDDRVFLRDAKSRLIIWPRDFLPESSSSGEEIKVLVNKDGINSEVLAKGILNELLNIGKKTKESFRN